MSQWSGLRTIARKHEVFEISASIKHNVYFMNNCLTKQSFLGDKIEVAWLTTFVQTSLNLCEWYGLSSLVPEF